MIEVKFNQLELAIADVVAQDRSSGSRKAGVVDQKKFKEKSGFFIDRLGIIGEMAVAKALNVCPIFNNGPQANGYDLLYEGLRIDVKTTERSDGNLIIKIKENPDVDTYCLVRWDEENSVATIVGYMPKHEVRQKEHERWIRRSCCYFVSADKLKSIK